MNTKSVFAICLACLFSVSANGQSDILENYIQESLRSNLQFKQEQLNIEKSLAGLDQSRSLFFPQLSINASYTLANGGRKITIPVGDLMNPVYTTLNQLTGTDNFPQIENSTTQFLPNNFHDTKLRLIQPLFNSDIYYGYKAQKELISVQQAQKNAYENQLRFSVTSAYLQYLQSEEAITILKSSKIFVNELVKFNEKLYVNNKVTRDVLLSSEYELAKVDQQLSEAEKNNQSAKSYFNFLLNRDWNSEILEDSLMISTSKSESVEVLARQAWENREEIKQLQGASRASDVLVSMANSNKFLPQLSAVADIGYQGFYYKFDNDQRYTLVQFNLAWDLFKAGAKKAKLRQTQFDQQILENKLEQRRRQIELEVIQAYNELKAAEKSLVAAEAGIESAEKAFQIINARYREGQALLIELMDAKNKLTLSQLSLSVNRFELLRKEAALQKAIAGS